MSEDWSIFSFVNSLFDIDIFSTQADKSNNIIDDSKKDHRIAMSFAIMGLVSSTKVIISDSKYINTSFPNFIKLLNKIGGKII